MARIYTLKPTPSDHPLKDRPFYHDVRSDLHEMRKLAVPAPIDHIDHTAGVAPIFNQLSLSSCQSVQLRNALLMAQWLVTGKLPAVDLSVLFAYWATRSVDNADSEDQGDTIGNTLVGFEENGICEESFWPYDVTKYNVRPSDLAFANAGLHKYDLRAVQVKMEFQAICDALQDGSPIIGGFSVPPSLENCGKDGHLPDPTGEPSLGGHAFSVSQFSRSDQWMDFPNSWSADWGHEGHCYLPAQYIGRLWELWTFVPGSLLE